MKLYLSLSSFLFLFTSIAFAQSVKFLSLENRLPEKRTDELIVLKRDFLEKQFGTIPSGKYIIIHPDSNVPIIIQHDDINGDGDWDEVSFLFSFGPLEKLTLPLSLSDNPPMVEALARAHVRLKKRSADNTYSGDLNKEKMPANLQANDFTHTAVPLYQTEGPAWENDKVAFRLYFDVRNAVDLFGKTTNAMVMDTVGSTGDKYYHTFDKRWGMDILKVGKSLGAGSVALLAKLPNGKDTLVRVGGSNIGLTSYRKIADGPVRAVFKMYYEKWDMLGDKNLLNVTEEISIWGGQYFYESKVKIENALPGTRVVTGIANYGSKRFIDQKIGDSRLLFSFDKQSDNHDNLGMAILAKSYYTPAISSIGSTSTDVQNTYTFTMNDIDNKGIRYRFYMGWEKTDPQFNSLLSFEKFMKGEATKYNSSIKVSW